MYRISQNGQEPIVDVDTVDQLEPAIRASEPGRYHVDEIVPPIRSLVATLRAAGVSGSTGAMGRLSLTPIRGLVLDQLHTASHSSIP